MLRHVNVPTAALSLVLNLVRRHRDFSNTVLVAGATWAGISLPLTGGLLLWLAGGARIYAISLFISEI